jgi:hypothetical protein
MWPITGLDGGASSQVAFDDAEDAALLSRDEDAARVLGVMTAVTLPQGVTIVRIVGQCPGVEHELADRGAGVGDDDRDLDAELVRS